MKGRKSRVELVGAILLGLIEQYDLVLPPRKLLTYAVHWPSPSLVPAVELVARVLNQAQLGLQTSIAGRPRCSPAWGPLVACMSGIQIASFSRASSS